MTEKESNTAARRMKKYGISGIISYATLFNFEVEATSKREAREKARAIVDCGKFDDAAIAEVTNRLIDTPSSPTHDQ